ncbi:DUF2306 domain-containing protein [Saccharothrix isguenensis]
MVTKQRTVGLWWLALTAGAIAVYAPLPYLTTSLGEMAAEGGGLAAHYAAQPGWTRAVLYAHMVVSGPALLLSPLQLSTRVRAKAPRLHRALGRVVVVAMVAGGAAGGVLAPFSAAGWIGTAGFGLLAVLSVAFPLLGLRAVRAGDVPAHRRWMVRAFAMVYAGVALRLGVLLLMPVTGDFMSAYLFMPFGSWVPNLLVAEWVLRRGRVSGRPAASPLPA